MQIYDTGILSCTGHLVYDAQYNVTQRNKYQHNDTLLYNQHNYRTLSCIEHTFYIENDAEIFLAHYAWKVAEKGLKMAFMMNKLAMNNSCEIILEK